MLPGADPQRLARGVAAIIRTHVQRQVAPLRERIEQLEKDNNELLGLIAELQAEREGD